MRLLITNACGFVPILKKLELRGRLTCNATIQCPCCACVDGYDVQVGQPSNSLLQSLERERFRHQKHAANLPYTPLCYYCGSDLDLVQGEEPTSTPFAVSIGLLKQKVFSYSHSSQVTI